MKDQALVSVLDCQSILKVGLRFFFNFFNFFLKIFLFVDR